MTTTTSPEPSSSPSAGRDALASLRIERPDPRQQRAASRKKLWWIAALVILGAGGYAGYRFVMANQEGGDGFGSGAAWMPEIMQNRIEVRLTSVTVQKGRSADAVVVATGYLESRRQARIGARAVGRIDIINFEEGDRVAEGELLAELEHRDLDASLAAAKASVSRAKAALALQEIAIEQAKLDQDRSETLWESRSVADADYDAAKFAYRTAIAQRDSIKAEIALAEAQERQAQQQKENMFIRAPFDGTVISKDAEVGESILPGGMGGGSGRGSVATIADLDHLEIEVDVQEDFISRVGEGQEAEIAVDAVQDKKYHGVVRKIIPMGDRARATIKVQVAITDADSLLFPEMAGTVYFLPTEQELEASDKPRYFCPTSAVTTDSEGATFVWIVDEEKRAQRLPVKTGEERDGRIEVIEGVQGRERVVVNPEELQVGSPVQVAE